MMFLSLMGRERPLARSVTAAKLEDIMEQIYKGRRYLLSVDEPALAQSLKLRLVQPNPLLVSVE